MSDLKTPAEWCVIEHVEIMDPDGWRGRGGRPWTDPITLAEFKQRLVTCTMRHVGGAAADDREPFRNARDAGLKQRHETREARAASRLPEHVRGDGPCSNCGTRNNPIWFTESVFWNAVVRVEPRLTDDAEILCIPCFIVMADQRGYKCYWRLLPEFHWETKAEAAKRSCEPDCEFIAPHPSHPCGQYTRERP